MARWIFAFTSTVAFASIFFLPQDLHPSLQSINSIFELKIFCFAFSQTLVLTSRMTTSSQTLFSLHPHAGFIDDECKVIEEPTRLKSGSDNLRSNRVLTSRSFLAKSLSTCLASALLTCASGGFIPDPSLAASLDDFAVVSAKTFHSNSEKIYQNNPTNRTPFKFSTLSVSDSTTTSITNDMKNLGLKPPTADRPQIMLNNNFRKVPMNTLQPEDTPATLFLKSSNKKKPAREPILQGLVYFPQKAGSDATTSTSQTTATSETTPLPSPPMDMKPKPQLDLYSDILVLTAISANHPDGPILAGAKFPVADVRFPFQFQMFQENLLINREGVKEAWFGTASSDGNSNKMCGGVAATQDVIIRAYICPSDASSFPCDAGQAKRYAEGIAKLITDLEGMGEGDVIRAPASLALR